MHKAAIGAGFCILGVCLRPYGDTTYRYRYMYFTRTVGPAEHGVELGG